MSSFILSIGNLASAIIHALSTAGAARILRGDIFLALVIRGPTQAWMLSHYIIAIESFLIFPFTILAAICGWWAYSVTAAGHITVGTRSVTGIAGRALLIGGWCCVDSLLQVICRDLRAESRQNQ
jgi:hypothetical protein